MAYQSIFGSTGASNPYLAGKANPFTNDFQPGKYAAINAATAAQKPKAAPTQPKQSLLARALNDLSKAGKATVHAGAVVGKGAVNIGKSIAQAPAGLLNTTIAIPARTLTAQVTGNKQAQINAEHNARTANTPQQVAGNILGTGSLLVGGGALSGVSKSALAKVLAKTVASGAAGGAGAELSSNPKPGFKDVAKSAALGAGLGIGGALISKGLSAVVSKVKATPQLQNLASISQAGGQRPYASVQTAIEKAHNAGNNAQAATLIQKLPDAGTRDAMRSSLGLPTTETVLKFDKTTGKATRTPKNEVSAAAVGEKSLIEPSISLRKSPGSNLLPTAHTKEANALQKAYLSSTGLIAKQGKAGQQLAKAIGKSRDTAEIYQADIMRRVPAVTSLGKKDFGNFVDAVEGKGTAQSSKIAQAVKEWKSVTPEIRQRATSAGIDVGNLGETYFPHYHDYNKLFKDKNAYNDALNHLVQSGQAKDPQEAIKQLSFARGISRSRTINNLDKSRIIDLPGYDKSKNALLNYISGAAHSIGQAEHLGPKDEKGLALIEQIARENGDAQTAKKAYDIAVGAKTYEGASSKVSKALRGYMGLTKLGKGAITNATQNVNTAIVSGHLRTIGSAIQGLASKEARDFVKKTGVVGDSVIRDLSQGAGFDNKWIRSIGAPGFGTVEKSNRSIAALAGRNWANSLAKKGSPRTVGILRNKLGVEGDIGKQLTESQQIQAARKLVELTQFKVDPQDLPMWTSSPSGKLVSQFRTFSYKQTGFVTNEILKPLAKGNVKPLARLLAALPVGYGTYSLKNKLSNRQNEQNPTRRTLAIWQAVGGGGLPVDIPSNLVPPNKKYQPSGVYSSRVASALGGPTVGTAFNMVDALGKAATGDRRGAERLGVQQIPVVGTTLANTLTPTKPVTSAAKMTAVSQVNQALRQGDMEKAKQAADAYNKQVTSVIQKHNRAYGKDELTKALNDATIKTTPKSLKSRATRLNKKGK